MTEVEVKVGSRWVRRRSNRVARVVAVNGAPWNSVEYRYSTPRDGGYGRGRGIIEERTNTTSMTVTRFLHEFSPAVEKKIDPVRFSFAIRESRSIPKSLDGAEARKETTMNQVKKIDAATLSEMNAEGAKMQRAFALVSPDRNGSGRSWKEPIAEHVSVASMDGACVSIDDVLASVLYMTGTSAKVERAGSSCYYVTAPGYYAGPCN